LLRPFLPDASEKIFAQLGLAEGPERFEDLRWGGLKEGHACGVPQPLFPRKDLAKTS
jgi:methionyl-tRNA synthetase